MGPVLPTSWHVCGTGEELLCPRNQKRDRVMLCARLRPGFSLQTYWLLQEGE